MSILRAIRSVWETDPRVDPNPLVYTILAVGAILYPFWAEISSGGSGDFAITVAADAGVYILLAIGLNVVIGFAGLLDLGYAAFFAIGAYTYAFLASEHLASTPLQTAVHLPFWIVLFIALFVAAAFGLVLGAPTLRLRGDYLAIVTLGFGEIIRVVVLNIDAIGGARGMPNIPAMSSFGWVYGILVLTLFVVWRLIHSRQGREFLAVREDEIAAEAMGVNTTSAKVRAFATGAFFAGVSGALFAHYLRYLNPQTFDFNRSFEVIIMVVLGGLGSLTGSVVAAVFLTVLK
ncbi:MAG TPA: branched-chain amino acid ABC transporter permease, partial [Candidatus Limnocylindria bacterium]